MPTGLAILSTYSATFVSHGAVAKSDEAIALPHWVSLALLWGTAHDPIAKTTNTMAFE
jgi:hypothetical protein